MVKQHSRNITEIVILLSLKVKIKFSKHGFENKDFSKHGFENSVPAKHKNKVMKQSGN